MKAEVDLEWAVRSLYIKIVESIIMYQQKNFNTQISLTNSNF